MIKYLALFIFTISMTLLPVEKTSIIADKKLNEKEFKQILITLSLQEQLVFESEKLEFTPTYSEVVENNSEYSQEITNEPLEVKKEISFSDAKLAKAEYIEIIANLDEDSLSYNEVAEQAFDKEEVVLARTASFNFKIRNYDELNNNIIEDRISTAVAANEKSNSNNKSQSNGLSNDELVFFDYTEDGKVNVLEDSITNQIDYSQASNQKEVTKVTHQVSGAKKVASPVQPELFDYAKLKKKLKRSSKKVSKSNSTDKEHNKDSEKNKVEPFNKGNKFLDDKEEEEKESHRCMSNKTSPVIKSDYSLSLVGVDYSENEYSKVYNFDLQFNDDKSRISDDGTGELKLNYKLTSDMNIRRGTLFNNSIYPTTMDFVFEGGSGQKIMFPVFERETFNSIIKDLGVTGTGGHLLVQLDDLTEDIDLDVDTKYQAKIFLDNNLEIVDRAESEYTYILYIGVDTGNTIAMFKNNKNEISSKIIHITEDEIYFEPNFYAEILSDELALFQESLTTQCKSLLNISKSAIKPWSFDSKKTSKSLNIVSFDKMIYPLGARKYFELNHLEERIFVGKWSEQNVVVPTESYIRHVLDSLDVAENDCVAQLNISKPIKSLHVGSMSKSSLLAPEVSYLDDDGIFYDEGSAETKKIFVRGEEQGVINVKLDYTDGSSQFIQTYCSENTYLVEQL